MGTFKTISIGNNFSVLFSSSHLLKCFQLNVSTNSFEQAVITFLEPVFVPMFSYNDGKTNLPDLYLHISKNGYTEVICSESLSMYINNVLIESFSL